MEDYLLSELNDFVDNKFTNQEYTTISVDNTNVFLFFQRFENKIIKYGKTTIFFRI